MIHMHIQCESRSIRSGVGCEWDQEEGKERERKRKEKKRNVVEDYECRAASVGFDGQVYTHERLSPHA